MWGVIIIDINSAIHDVTIQILLFIVKMLNILISMKERIKEVIGWYGTIVILGAYALNSFSIISAHSLVYQGLNITGSIGIVVISFSKKVYQPMVLNIVWALIGIIGVLQIFSK